MPDMGLTKALERAAKQGAREAKVVRPGQVLAEEAAARAKMSPEQVAAAEALAKEARGTGEPRRGRPPKKTAPTIEDTKASAVDADGAEIVPAKIEEPPQPKPLVDQPLETPASSVPADNAPAAIDPTDKLAVQAQALDNAELKNFDLDAEHQPNFDVINTTDDVKALVAEVSQQNAGKIDEARRGTITNEQLQGLAADLDVRSDVVSQILGRETGDVVNAETILAARQVLHASASRLKQLATKVTSGEATGIERVQFARQLQFHNEYQTQFMGARAEAGRALNAFGIPTNMDEGVAHRIDEILQATGGNIDQMAKAIEMAPDVRGVTKIAKAGIMRRSGRAAQTLLNRIFVNGVLSGPLSHITNVMGNGVYQAMNTAEMAIAARLGKFMPGPEHVEVGEAMANLRGTVQATRDAFRLASLTARTGRSLDDIVAFERTASQVGTLQHLPELDKPYLGRVVKIMDAVVDAPTARAMGAEDEFFKTLAYRGSLERQAFLNLRNQVDAGVVKTPDDARRVVQDFMENTPEAAQQEAEEWARDMAFQTPLGPTGQKAQAFLRSVPALTLIAPFIRTPVNIFKSAASRSPLALASSKFWKDVEKGGRSRDMALTKFAMGSATATMVAQMAIDGEITGAGPSQPEARQLWEANGRRPYSVKIGDEWHSYARMEPLASVLGIVADSVEIGAYLNADTPQDDLKSDDQQMNQLAGSIITGIMNNTGNKTFMKGISDFVELLSDPSRNWNSYKNQMGSSLVPYSAAMRSVRNVQDPLLREAWTLRDKMADNVPGYSADLPPRRGLFGELREKNAGSILGVMSPMPESPEKGDYVVSQLQDLMQQTKLVPMTMPSKDVEGMRLNAREYEHLIRIGRRDPVFGDKTLKDQIGEIMDSAEYQRSTPTMRVEVIKDIQSRADKIARAALESEDPEYAARIEAFRAKRNSIRFDQ
jgi:hypothetical protein